MDQLNMVRSRWADLPQPQKIKNLRYVVFVCYSIALLFFVIYAFGGTKKHVSDPSNVVVFMQSSPGGLMALRYLTRRADVSIAMIVLTVNAWSANLNAAYDNTVAFLHMLKEEGVLKYNISVYYGNSVAQVNSDFDEKFYFPLDDSEAPNITSCTYRRVLNPDLLLEGDYLFGASELLDKVHLPAPTTTTTTTSGQYEFFDSSLSTYLSKHTAAFLVLGPSTDAAAFLQGHSNLRGKVSRIVVAGGVLSTNGNTRLVYPPNWRSEQNAFFDPHAANYILGGSHGRPVELLPTDALPEWPPSLYESLIVSRTYSSTSVAASAQVVARALFGYNKRFALDMPLPVEMLAASYFADVSTRSGASVASMHLLVANGVSMATDGLIGAPNKESVQKGAFKVKVILSVKKETFWSHVKGVDEL